MIVESSLWLVIRENSPMAVIQARSQEFLLGGSFGQNVDLFGKIVNLFYKTVDLLSEIEDIFSKIMAF